MGSPYFVHKQVNRIHVVKTPIGFERILKVVARSMGTYDWAVLAKNEGSPEYSVLSDLFRAEREAAATCSRVLVFLEARYEWRNWEKFQRVIVFDYSGQQRKKARLPLLDVEWELVTYDWSPLFKENDSECSSEK